MWNTTVYVHRLLPSSRSYRCENSKTDLPTYYSVVKHVIITSTTLLTQLRLSCKEHNNGENNHRHNNANYVTRIHCECLLCYFSTTSPLFNIFILMNSHFMIETACHLPSLDSGQGLTNYMSRNTLSSCQHRLVFVMLGTPTIAFYTRVQYRTL